MSQEQTSPLHDHPHADHPIALEFPATIAVIGGGPIGLEATLYGRFLGYEVTLFEQGEVADNVRQWQHCPMWTPFQHLHSRLGRMAITTQNPQHVFPELQREQTGEEWLRHYLLPLAETDLVAKSLRSRHRVLSVSRCHYSKHQTVPLQSRWQDGFVVVWQDATGAEHRDTFDFVLDTSGTFHQQLPWGAGGSPALGESQLLTDRGQDPVLRKRLHFVAPNFAANRGDWEDARVLVIGDSPQAAQTVIQWKSINSDRGQLTWAIPQSLTQTGLYPIIANDPLPARMRLFETANALILRHQTPSIAELVSHREGNSASLSKIQVVANTNLSTIQWQAEPKCFQVGLLQWHDVAWDSVPEDYEEPDDVETTLAFDRVVIALGHRVDEGLTRELIVPRCPQSEALQSLLGPLLAHPGDRLDFQFLEPRWTMTPEGRYFVLGAKSFGRLPNYFYRLGLQQVRDAFRWIVGRATLDLEQTLRF